MNGVIIKSFETTSTSYTIPSLTAGTNYSVGVRAYKNGKYGIFAQYKYFTTPAKQDVAPAQIKNLKATQIAENSITVIFDKDMNATKYEIYYGTTISNMKTAGTTSVNNVTIKNLAAGTKYYIKVRGISAGGKEGTFSSSITATTSKAAVTVPNVTNINVTNITATSAKATWSAVSGATKYEVVLGMNGVIIKSFETSSTSYTIPNLTAGTNYSVGVRAYKNGTYGIFAQYKYFTTSSATVATKPGNVTNLKFAGLDGTTGKFTYNSASNADGYDIYLSTNNGAFQNIGAISSNRLSIRNLKAGTSYQVKILAYRMVNGQKIVAASYSNTVSFNVPAQGNNNGTIGLVSNIKVTNIKETSAIVSWSPVSGATQYQVYYRLENQTLGLSRTVIGTSIQLTGLGSGTAYCVNVKAIKGNVGGNYNANPVKFTTLNKAVQTPTKPALVSNIKVSNITDSTATVTWNAVSGATKYYVYYRLSNSNQGYAIATTQTSARLSGLASGTAYCVNVKAMNGNISGDYNANPTTFTTIPKAAPQADFYYGTYELPIQGATGWASITLNIREKATSNSTKLGTVPAGNSFTILSQEGDWLKVRFQNQSTGYVYAPYVLLNLPDVIPSIVYYDSNSASSLFKSSGVSIDNITGNRLYNVYNNNTRLGEYQYDMPVLYGMAAKIAQAQKAALAEGYSLKIYESFRPYDTQTSIANAVKNLINSNQTVANGIKVDGWSIGWFISTGTSNHQQGIAIDVSLVKVNSMQTKTAGNYKYNVVASCTELQMPTAMHELSVAAARYTTANSGKYAKTMNDNALRLERYCKNAGLTGLASEWWHFNDNGTLNSIGQSYRSNGNYRLQPNLSIQP